MVDLIVQKFIDPRFIAALIFAVAAAATVVTLALPYLSTDSLKKRMQSAALERDAIRARERARIGMGVDSPMLRSEAKGFMKDVVDRLQLEKRLGVEGYRLKMTQAGYRGRSAEVALMFYRLVAPIIALIFALVYFVWLNMLNQTMTINLSITAAVVLLGIKLPGMLLDSQVQKRQLSIKRAWPDSLDLTLICVESGMSIEQAFRRVSAEVGSQSVALAEELVLTTAELSYLQERRQAYENLAKRTNIESVKAVTTALAQAERYGTPLGGALRVLAQESRDMRMQDAEKKAMSLPPKLTVPMILFFLPVLLAVIMAPAVINTMGLK